MMTVLDLVVTELQAGKVKDTKKAEILMNKYNIRVINVVKHDQLTIFKVKFFGIPARIKCLFGAWSGSITHLNIVNGGIK